MGKKILICAKNGEKIQITPGMCRGLFALYFGGNLSFETTCVGRPTKQRLVKFGLAEYLQPKDWDGPMKITDHGRRVWQSMNRPVGQRVQRGRAR